jgi:hypothetical protein
MKYLLPILFLFILVTETALAQTISDYYLPLKVGSHVTLYTPETGTWGARTSTYSIEGTDVISGKQYFREVGRENPSPENLFQVFWLWKDAAGNVAMTAMSTTSTNVDSSTAMVASLMPNEFLTLGYSRTYYEGENRARDSVESISETVNVTAGTFTNCLKISNVQYDGSGAVIFCEYSYYAKGIGVIQEVRTIPANQAHVAGLIEYGVTGVSNNNTGNHPGSFSLSQNYPNPFNPSTAIKYAIETESNVNIKFYNSLGQIVREVSEGNRQPGNYEINFNSTGLASGIYFYSIKAVSLNGKKDFSAVKKMVLLK